MQIAETKLQNYMKYALQEATYDVIILSTTFNSHGAEQGTPNTGQVWFGF